VDERGPPHRHDVGRLETTSLRGGRSELCNSRRMTDEVRRRQVGEVADCGQRPLGRFAVQHQPRARLAGKRLVPA
jgi:hypothetical protein